MHYKLRLCDRPISALVEARCRLLGFAQRTAKAYAVYLAAFEDWAATPAVETTQEQAAAWLSRSGPARPNAAYIERCAIVFLWRHLRGSEVDPRIIPSRRQPPARVAEVADPAELAALFAALRDPQQRRFCQFLYATGLRLGEALAVRVRDLDRHTRSVVVVAGKGGRSRRSILPDAAIAALGPVAWHRPDALVFSVDGRPDGALLRRDTLHEALRCARHSIGMHRRLSLHRLRHCFATHLHERGVGLVELQRLLGHHSPLTTLLYIGLRERRRREVAEIGDLLAALPKPELQQQRIEF